MQKGHTDKAKGGQDQGWEVGMGGAEESGGGKMGKTVLEEQFKKKDSSLFPYIFYQKFNVLFFTFKSIPKTDNVIYLELIWRYGVR